MAYHKFKNALPPGDYCMYLRKSRTDIEAEAHGEGETLLRHENMLLNLAANLGIHISKDSIYREVVSGETIAARPDMQRLLIDVANGKWKGVLVVEVERLARGDTSDQGTVAKTFKRSSTLIVTLNKIYDPDNEFDEEYFEFSLFMSRREFKTINRRLQNGRIASVEEGKYIGAVAPYGYEKVKIKHDKGYTLAKNDENEFAELMFILCVKGELQEDGTYLRLGCTRIGERLDEMGCKPRKGEKWSKSSIKEILRNPIYAGMIRWGYKKESKEIVNGKTKKHSTKNTGKVHYVKGLHPATVSMEMFEAAQNILDSKGHASVPGSKELKNSLSGLLYCGKCGKLMYRLSMSKKNPYDTVKCANKKCDNVSSPLYLVEETIIDSLKSWINDFEIKWASEKIDRPYSNSLELKQSSINNISSELTKLNNQREKLYTLLEQGIYTTELFIQRNKKLTQDIEALEENLIRLEKEYESLQKQSHYNDIFIPRAKQILETYYDVHNSTTRNENLKDIVERIEYIKNEPNKKGNRDNKNFEIGLFPRIVEF